MSWPAASRPIGSPETISICVGGGSVADGGSGAVRRGSHDPQMLWVISHRSNGRFSPRNRRHHAQTRTTSTLQHRGAGVRSREPRLPSVTFHARPIRPPILTTPSTSLIGLVRRRGVANALGHLLPGREAAGTWNGPSTTRAPMAGLSPVRDPPSDFRLPLGVPVARPRVTRRYPELLVWGQWVECPACTEQVALSTTRTGTTLTRGLPSHPSSLRG
jgi:hypothetical protein